VRPESFVVAHPTLINLPDRTALSEFTPLPPLFACMDQAGVTQHVNVLHHAKTGHLRKRIDIPVVLRGPSRSKIQNRPTRSIRQGFPDRIQVAGHQARLATTAPEKSRPMLRDNAPSFSDALRCAGSRNPIARCRRVTLVPPATWSDGFRHGSRPGRT